MKCPKLNQLTWKRLDSAYRTASSTTLCLVIMNFYLWAGALTYISPALSVVSISSATYFGHVLSSSWQVIYSTVLGALLGVATSYTWNISYSLQLTLLFISLTILNKVSTWERLAKVVGALSCLIAAIYPNVTKGTTYGIVSFPLILLMMFIPFVITGIILIFPFPKLATVQAKRLLVEVCDHINQIIDDLTLSVLSLDSIDLYTTDAEYLFSEVEQRIEALVPLCGFALWEKTILPRSAFPEALAVFTATADKIVLDLRATHRILKHMSVNNTQEKFSELLQEPLHALCQQLSALMHLIQEHLLHQGHSSLFRPSSTPHTGKIFKHDSTTHYGREVSTTLLRRDQLRLSESAMNADFPRTDQYTDKTMETSSIIEEFDQICHMMSDTKQRILEVRL